MAIILCFVSGAYAAGDPLDIGGLEIVDTEHSAWWHEKAGTLDQVKNETENEAEDEPVQDLDAPTPMTADGEAYMIGNGPGAIPAEDMSEPAPATADVSGEWTFQLADETSRKVDLDLYQVDGVVFGRGNMAASTGDGTPEEPEDRPTQDEGIDSMIWWLDQEPAPVGSASQVAASGSVVGDNLELDLVSLEELALYRLTLVVGEEAATGNYEAYGSDGTTWFGSVVAVPSL